MFDCVIFTHRLCGVHDPRKRYGLSGRRVCRLRTAGDSPYPRRWGKRVDTCGFYPLTSRSPLGSHGEICRAETIRERQEFKEEGHSFNPRTAREQCLAAYGQTAGVPFFLPQPRARQSHPKRHPFSRCLRLAAHCAARSSCVMSTSVCPDRCNRSNSSSTLSAAAGSSPAVGSSARITHGSVTTARAIATRCCCPPESWCGR